MEKDITLDKPQYLDIYAIIHVYKKHSDSRLNTHFIQLDRVAHMYI